MYDGCVTFAFQMCKCVCVDECVRSLVFTTGGPCDVPEVLLGSIPIASCRTMGQRTSIQTVQTVETGNKRFHSPTGTCVFLQLGAARLFDTGHHEEALVDCHELLRWVLRNRVTMVCVLCCMFAGAVCVLLVCCAVCLWCVRVVC